jgi:GNAT superfamily N-acetyltransferase
VSVYLRLNKRIMAAGCAEASRVRDTEWYVNRVFIRPEFRRQGIGRALVLRMLEEVTRQGCTKLVLTPGGYDLPYEVQRDFYVACGFRVINDDDGLLEYP